MPAIPAVALQVPYLGLQALVNTTASCLSAACSTPAQDGFCLSLPSHAEAAFASPACPAGQWGFTITPTGHAERLDAYETTCYFDREECAEDVCALQKAYSSMHFEDAGWACFSDPAVAEYAQKGLYWFASWPYCRNAHVTCVTKRQGNAKKLGLVAMAAGAMVALDNLGGLKGQT